MIKRYISYIAVGIIFVAAGFMTGYFIGAMISEKSNAAAAEEKGGIVSDNYLNAETPQIMTAEPVNYDIYYMLKYIDGRLRIYEVSGEISRPVREFKSSIERYPQIDREELEKGIVRKTFSEALETAENFTD